VAETELSARRAVLSAKGFQPAAPRPRKISTALRAYAALTTSAARGAVRELPNA
jgi:dihydroxy-acid dehydratase